MAKDDLMKRPRALLLACTFMCVSSALFAQMPMGGNPQDGGGGHMGRVHILPPGTWWRDSAVIQMLNLTPDQQKKLDDTFLQSRIQLVQMHASLEEEQLKLEPLLNANPPDQNRTMAEISRIADLRAELEKADAKMLLSLRAVLTTDQWTKLQDDHRQRRQGMQMMRQPHGTYGQGPQGGPGMTPPGCAPQ